MNYSNKTGK